MVEPEIVYVDEKRYIIDPQTGEQKEILSDISSVGKERPWAEHKRESLSVEQAYRGVAERSPLEKEYWTSKANRISRCGDYLMFNLYESESGKQQLKVKHANSCRVRLCPLCSWRRSLKIGAHMRKIIDKMQEQNKYDYLLLTLTVPNVPAEELSAKLTQMLKAWNNLLKRKAVQLAVKGWYRGLEITHNVNPFSLSYDTYHPHFHVILAVNKTYFKSANYIHQPEWLELWQQAMQDYSIKEVDVRKIRKSEGESIIGAICELSKYTVKSGDYILSNDWKLTLDSVETLDAALTKRRLVAFGGVMKEWHKKLNLDDEIDGELIEDGDSPNGELIGEVCYAWNVGYQQYLKKN
ncbi:MAG: protein rep [Oscillospiraceae bacterium]|nr:protein rep [Oscillospiraceae bacterium]